MLLQIFGHCAFPILGADKLLVGQPLPLEDELVRKISLTGHPIVNKNILEGCPLWDLVEIVDQSWGCLVVPGEHGHRGRQPEEVESPHPSLRQPVQLAVRLNHGEGVAVGLADHHQSVHQLLRSLVEGWRVFAPVHLGDDMYEDKMQN